MHSAGEFLSLIDGSLTIAIFILPVSILRSVDNALISRCGRAIGLLSVELILYLIAATNSPS